MHVAKTEDYQTHGAVSFISMRQMESRDQNLRQTQRRILGCGGNGSKSPNGRQALRNARLVTEFWRSVNNLNRLEWQRPPPLVPTSTNDVVPYPRTSRSHRSTPMSENESKSPSLSYVRAENRVQAVKKMILPDPLLKALYVDGAKKGRQRKVGSMPSATKTALAYRLLFYVDRIPIADEFRSMETYEVLYGSVKEYEEVNFPRVLFTTTGAINLMRDGIPSARFVAALRKGILEITPYKLGHDVKTEALRKSGSAYLCIYDRDGEGIRVLDLLDYLMVYDDRNNEEIQVHTEDELVVGDTRFVRPFLLRYSKNVPVEREFADTTAAADEMLRNMKS